MRMPNSACWNITKICNDNCLFCYRDQESEELNLEDRIKVIEKVAESGIRKLTFAGGEPLMLTDIQELIQHAKCKDLLVSMTTNGILLKGNILDFCLEKLDWLTLSLDGADEKAQVMMTRSEGHVKRILDILRYAESYDQKRCKIKINTVISSINKHQITDIADLLLSFHIDRWKLFQFVPLRGMAKKNDDAFYISDTCFYETISNINKYMEGRNLLISISDRENIESGHFVIFPNGDIKISKNLEDRVIGNVLIDDLYQLWKNDAYQKDIHEQRTKFIRENY